MIRFALIAAAAAMIWAAPAIANECTEQLAALQQEVESQQSLDDDRKDQIENLMVEASEANKDGDEETCLAALEDARALLDRQ